MQPSVRRVKIIELLNLRRRDTMQNLADEFGVSWDTIQRDITILEQEYPLEITRGNGGGVAFPDGYHLTQRHLTAKQAQAVREAGLRLDIEAPVPEAPSMTMALERYIVEYNKSNK